MLSPRFKYTLVIFLAGCALCLFLEFDRKVKEPTKNTNNVIRENTPSPTGKSSSLPHVTRAVESHPKWIVVTTIQAPTPQVKRLAQIPGWKLLVIGDAKTPADWSIPGVIYLSLDDQKRLNYSLLQWLLPNTYTRKVLGYLYAIENGAEVIYETDDDTEPYANLTLFHSSLDEAPKSLLYVNTNGSNVYNPLPHYGQSSMWPRGYPLDRIGMEHHHMYSTCFNPEYPPSVQAGLIEGDPDVDALFRLTRKHDKVPLDLKFDKSAPLVALPAKVFSPYNTQNTVVTKRAFWSLILPISVTFRETDIIRSYWAQTLLWLIGDSVVFYPPTSYQKRNPHSYIKDMKEEERLYYNVGEMIDYLTTWQCNEGDLFKCIRTLTSDLIVKEILETPDYNLINAWLNDLVQIGYKPPALSSNVQYKCQLYLKNSMIFHSLEQNTSMPMTGELAQFPDSYKNSYAEKIQMKISSRKFVSKQQKTVSDSVLIIIGNTKLDNLKDSLFSQSLYCIEDKKNLDLCDNMHLSCVLVEKVTVMNCMHKAVSLGYDVKQYIYIDEKRITNDRNVDAFKNIFLSLISSDLPKFEVLKQFSKNISSPTRDGLQSIANFKRFSSTALSDCLNKSTISSTISEEYCDLLYIPIEYENSFLKFYSFLNDKGILQNNAMVSKVLKCLSKTTIKNNHLSKTDNSTKEHLTQGKVIPKKEMLIEKNNNSTTM